MKKEEFVSAREASRGFSALVAKLSSGEARRFFILHRNRPRAVLLSLEEYERLKEYEHLRRQEWERA